MNLISKLPVWLVAALMVSAFATPHASAASEPNVVQVRKDHYRGTWLEIGRRPMFITDGCVAGYTTYKRGARADDVMVEDGCYEGTPSGKQKTINGDGKLMDAGTTNAKLQVRYPFFITWQYWVLYEAPDHSWFISADPKMKNLWIYARTAPSRSKLAIMVRKAKALGYDTSLLEFPPTK